MRRGDKVIFKGYLRKPTHGRQLLTVGKEYEILREPYGCKYIRIKNDAGIPFPYPAACFELVK